MIDLANQIFGRWTALSPAGRNADGRMTWLCRCTCGVERTVSEPSLRKKWSRSCGCLRSEEARIRNRILATTHGKSRDVEGKLIYTAKTRAKKYGLPFNIDITDIIVPRICPLLNIPLFRTSDVRKYRPNSPSLDRKIPHLGYVKGNVWVISYKANMIKSVATLDEFELVAKNWRASL